MATTMKSVVLFCFIASFTVISAQVQDCNVPSRFWCENKDIAAKCGVLEQCQKFEWTETNQKVEFVLYYESLCPDCRQFITEMLYPHYSNLSSIMNLTLVPYGNAQERKVGDKWVFECQHGEQECIGNLIETCAIALVKDITKYFPFINCMEKSYKQPEEAAKQCSTSFAVPLEDILKCSKSDFGNKLEHEMAAKTDALEPSHQYVPWITVNGVHTEDIQKEAQDNIVKLICDTYKGTKPQICK
ncbi:hypothetical protein EGW08_004844 [Elysia chlorotica]|uniref:Saposin A-type domain-containing protein n=1 Tax=Elysia chlorotica TaxID=188477 RepID=A0A3S1CAG2_ELYCH|nr:hypothetical protein EGW08_004844 [Elysia chlorotica]